MAGKKIVTYCPSAVRPEMPTATRDAVQGNEMTFVSVSCHRLLLDSSHQLLLNFFSSGAINFFSTSSHHEPSTSSHLVHLEPHPSPSQASLRHLPSRDVIRPIDPRCPPPDRPEMPYARSTRLAPSHRLMFCYWKQCLTPGAARPHTPTCPQTRSHSGLHLCRSF